MLFLRSLLWVVLLPGTVAGLIPWRYFGVSQAQVSWQSPRHIVAVITIAAGILLELACVVEFARRGRGTLSPADPPRHLVVQGLYRYVRNPMYLAISLILLGEALLLGSRALLLYWAVFFVCASAFVMLYEEPYLRSRFGGEYEDYSRRVGRWIPSLPSR
jgi:protein-S-isoprenylcysteine O-methyltransferase Ste14